LTELAVLNSMADSDFETALDRHLAWRLRSLDLKDSIFGGGVLDLSDDHAALVINMVESRGLNVYCVSTMIGHADIEVGEREFRARFRKPLQRAVELGGILRPRFVRLLAAQTSRRSEIADSSAYIRDKHPWLLDFYRDAIDQLSAAGFHVTIENEVGGCIWASEQEILQFLELLDRTDRVRLTWDIVNLWQMGSYPSVRGYELLRPHIGYVHLKGGRADPGSHGLTWASSLADASWPIEQIGRRVIEDGASPVLCLNPSHGARQPGYDYGHIVERDIEFVRALFPEVQ